MEAGTVSAVPMFEQRHSLLLSRLSDELLARQVTRGSARAFSALYQRYHQQLYRYCRSILREDADAQDAVQAAFTAAFSALRKMDGSMPSRVAWFRHVTMVPRSAPRPLPASAPVPPSADPPVGPGRDTTSGDASQLGFGLEKPVPR